jgi:tRNA (guanine-N7-)-methyltransferase
MNQYNSKNVTTDQNGPHKDLIKIASKYTIDNFKRPPAPFSVSLLDEILLVFDNYKEIILDTGCGTGESSYNLARKNPDHFVLGIDKSQDRLQRKNIFKEQSKINNYMIVRAQLLDMWPLLYKASLHSNWKITKQCIYYPNPWPKAKGVKRRWHASAIMPFICAIGGEIEIRSNWLIYLEEFKIVLEHFTGEKLNINTMKIDQPITAFEKKYHLSGQNIYQGIVNIK